MDVLVELERVIGARSCGLQIADQGVDASEFGALNALAPRAHHDGCVAGLKAAMLAHDAITCGASHIVLAGGMESMSNAPYLLPKVRGGLRLGHGRMLDHVMLDGLEDAYDIAPDGTRRSMGSFGEDCAAKYRFSRERQDAFAIESVARAQQATRDGTFAWEIVPVTVSGNGGDVVIDTDEGPRRIKAEKIPRLRPAFRKDGTITAASSSSINDGAAAILLMRESKATSLSLMPLARIVGHSAHAQEPSRFTTAPVRAIEKLCETLDWRPGDTDLFEISEAFAVVPIAAMAVNPGSHRSRRIATPARARLMLPGSS